MRKLLLTTSLCLACSLTAFPGSFWLKAGGGVATINGGDYNRSVPGSNDLFRVLYTNVSGVLAKLDRALELQFEAGYDITRRFSVGIGVGYLSTSEKSTIEYDWRIPAATFHDTLTVHPRFSAVPVTLNLHYFFPLGPVRLNLGAGAGVYLCHFSYENLYSSTQFDWNFDSLFTADKAVLGFQGGLGVEVSLGRRLAVVLDVRGRYARANNIKGDGNVSGSFFGSPYSVSVPGQYLWYYEFVAGEKSYPQTSFQAYEPKNPDISNARRGHFDFTGVAATLGFKVNL